MVGPNGAGKTTLAERVVVPATGLPLVNADLLAAQHWPDDAEQRAYDAARLAAGERERLLRRRASFVTETVFSHPSKLDLLHHAHRAGYRVTLHVVLIPVDAAVGRVMDRVARGGHSVPERKIRERHARLWPLVARAVGTVQEALVYDNSDVRRPLRLVATYVDGQCAGPVRWPGWAPIELVGRS